MKRTKVLALVVVVFLCCLAIGLYRPFRISPTDLTVSSPPGPVEQPHRLAAQLPVGSSIADKTNRDQFLELMKLRGEVTRLHQDLRNANATVVTNDSKRSEDVFAAPRPFQADLLFNTFRNVTPEDESLRSALVQKETQLQQCWVAFHEYAQKHNGELPQTVGEALTYFPPESTGKLDLANFDNFERPAGNLNLTRLEDPSSTVVLKEKSPVQFSNGHAFCMWLLANGNVLLVRQ